MRNILLAWSHRHRRGGDVIQNNLILVVGQT